MTEEKIENSTTLNRRISLIRVLPSTITLTAFCFGLTSIRFALFNKWEYAVVCIFISALLDAFDGKVARLLGQSSQFGAQLDSLSDLVCYKWKYYIFRKDVWFRKSRLGRVHVFYGLLCNQISSL